ncbi:MAG: A/G-specific adenine glycosylase [Bacteroidota bacterium]
MKLKNFSVSFFVDKLLHWYENHKRDLPWRSTKVPYRIWLSEILLQQTRVVQALPYYEKFIVHFPTVEDLANASEGEVLHLWQGLGYYSRARNLHACAKYIAFKLNGVFPSSYVELIKLPGIGPYTAAAVASIAFKEAVPVLDGNVYRVLSRIFGLKADISSSQGKKKFDELARQLMPADWPDSYNQALMEFGALHCTPKKPACVYCPFQKYCYAYATSTQLLLPVKTRKVKVKNRYFHYVVIHFNDDIYFKKRVEKDIWHGLYDFYVIEGKDKLVGFERLFTPLTSLIKRYGLGVRQSRYMPVHQLTHQRIHACFFHVYANSGFIDEADLLLKSAGLVGYANVYDIPLPILITRFCKKELL